MRQIIIISIIIVAIFSFVIQTEADDITIIDESSAMKIMEKHGKYIGGEIGFEQVLFYPDDRQIILLVSINIQDPNYEIWSVNIDGTNLKVLFKPPRQIPAGRKIKKTSWNASRVWISDMSFSPNGEYIVFEMFHSSYIANDTYGNDIYVIKKDGTGLFRITETPYVSEIHPFFLEDNRTIVYDTAQGKNLCSVQIDGTEDKELSFNIKRLVDFNIHPSGKIIGKDFENNNIWESHIKDVNTPKVKILPSEIAKGKRAFKWSRDGKKIMYTKEENGEDWIYIMDEDGKNQKKIIKGAGIDWSWDGKKILYYETKKVINPQATGWRKERWIGIRKIHTIE